MKKILSIVSVLICISMLFCACSSAVPAADETTEKPVTQDIFAFSEIGEGNKSFTFEVHDGEGKISSITVNTNKNTVGEALLEYAIIGGEQGDYGLYVKTVNGIAADYETDGAYWAFYINGDYASTGVDLTEINEKDVYSFRYEKG